MKKYLRIAVVLFVFGVAPAVTNAISFNSFRETLASVVGDLFNMPTKQVAAVVVANPVYISNTSAFLYALDSEESSTKSAVNFQFDVANTLPKDIYIHKDPSVALDTSTEGSALEAEGTISSISYAQAIPSEVLGDTSEFFIVRAGSSRTLSYNGSIDSVDGSSVLRAFKIKTVYFSLSESPEWMVARSNALTRGLDNLSVMTTLVGKEVSKQVAAVYIPTELEYEVTVADVLEGFKQTFVAMTRFPQ